MDNYQISKTVKISLRVTPTAKRNTYSVAWLVGCIPRVACFARNPGLGNRNTYSVAVGGSSRSIEAPSQPSPREGTEKVPFFYDQNGKCLRFVTSLSANRLNKAKIGR